MTAATGFRKRFLDRQELYGSFLKIPATMPAEILGAVGYDFVVVDEEHSPFNRETTDAIVLACRAWGIVSVVRVQSPQPAALMSVLDCGADGVLVPHVDSAEKARAVVAACRYRPGSRGFHRFPSAIVNTRIWPFIWLARTGGHRTVADGPGSRSRPVVTVTYSNRRLRVGLCDWRQEGW